MAEEQPTINELLVPLHVKYIQSLDTRKDDLEYWLTEHLRLNGLYWGLTALDLMNNIDALPRDEVIKYVKSLQHDNGGFGGDLHHDTHITHTLSAVQVLITLDAIDAINVEKVVECKFVVSLNKLAL
jgi:geranylgeranyl transferase type-2 subunit beta